MTRYINNRPDADVAREARTPVRLPQQTSSTLFQGWGPKF
jgi:hypothetical protein